MDFTKAVAGLFEHLENDAVEKAVMACVRIARGTKDHLNAAIFLRELTPDRNEVGRTVYDDISHLKENAQQFIWETSLSRWLEVHTLDFVLSGSNDEDEGRKRNVLKVAAGEIDGELDQWERSIADLTVPPGITGYDAAAFTDQFTRERAQMRLRIKALQTIKARLKARCLNYAIQIERQLQLQHQSEGFLEAVQNDVNNYFKARSNDVSLKLRKATQLAVSTELEDASLLLTEVRRALKAAADHFYPPVSEKVHCSDGIDRSMGDDQYLNRLQEFVSERVMGSTAKDLLRAECDHLTSFLRRLNEVASKGVHSAATVAESKQGLVCLYFFLFNLCQNLTEKQLEEASS